MATLVDNDQYVTFRLGAEVYALDVTSAREIVECTAITQIPRTPPWIRGVINLRGSVIPILDIKLKLGMGLTEQSVDSCAVIVEVTVDGEQQVIGILADAVLEVFEVDPKQIEPPPKFGSRLSTDVLKGMGRRGDELFLILDPEHAFSADEMAEATEVAAEIEVDDAPTQQAKSVDLGI